MGIPVQTLLVILMTVMTAQSFAQNEFYDWSASPTPPTISNIQYDNNPPTFAGGDALQAQIVRTEFGVPHITAHSLEELAFGVGIAYSQDNFCIIADQMLKVNSKRALYFGPGVDNVNVISDFAYLALGVKKRAESTYESLSENSRAMIRGYVRGVNQYLAETGVENLAPECAGGAWVKPITEHELFANFLSMVLLKSGELFKEAYLAAHPPQPAEQEQQQGPQPPTEQILRGLTVPMHDHRSAELGSNGWALGRDLTKSGRGALLANPHFANSGNLRFYEMHLKIPGHMNTTGVGIASFPLVQIGFNEHFGWTHTVSVPSSQFVMYKLRLAPNDPQKYIYQTLSGETQIRPIVSENLAIEVGMNGHAAQTLEHTIYRSHFGLMVAVPPAGLEWTQETAFAVRDANIDNYDIVDHWLGMNLATNLEEFKRPFKELSGLSWVNTMYADKEGNAFFIDGSSVPHLTPQALELLSTNPELIAIREQTGIVMLPGEHQVFEWLPTRRGLVPFEGKPQLLRSDFVQNSNDSYWLTHPDSPITNVSPMYGPINTPQRARTKMSLKMLGDAAGEDGLWTAREIWQNLYSNRGYHSEALREELIRRCQAHPSKRVRVRGFWPLPFGIVNIREACQALEGWDGLYNNDSRGAHVFRGFTAFLGEEDFVVPFDPEHPLTTPRDLKARNEQDRDPALVALAKGVEALQVAHIPMNARLGDIQFLQLVNPDGSPMGAPLPKHGGYESDGVFNIMGRGSLDDGTRLPRSQYDWIRGTGIAVDYGYPVGTGTSFAFALEYTDQGPEAYGILTYSQSVNSSSPHFRDQDELYAEKGFRRILYSDREIEENAISEVKTYRSSN
tara:strand:- start:12627 stop:15167 length:2541 start_codon:yes stop_codon:yes gene_type:complete